MERIVEMKLVPAWKSGDPAGIKTAFEELLASVDIRTFPEKYGTSKLSRVELSDWLFSVDHIELSYKIHYSGTELEYLSPGTRGIALLVLYLLMDEDDTRPLLIDQPEGNLDNSSVYKQLVPYIRKAKRRRQIILITHNPNLVVATDAEQVIIATAERPNTQPYPCIRYDSGGLEHSVSGTDLGIREAVCLLLEGGEDAFRARENRYSLVQL
jgi:ABC-type Mn2+/Zn2+ transport system ATPase subunit